MLASEQGRMEQAATVRDQRRSALDSATEPRPAGEVSLACSRGCPGLPRSAWW